MTHPNTHLNCHFLSLHHSDLNLFSDIAGSKSGHLWEFLLELLNNENVAPKHIKWENREMGIFRIIDSTVVADLWGKRKRNPKMTYEKLSRALR